jgi:hypothetical protein
MLLRCFVLGRRKIVVHEAIINRAVKLFQQNRLIKHV